MSRYSTLPAPGQFHSGRRQAGGGVVADAHEFASVCLKCGRTELDVVVVVCDTNICKDQTRTAAPSHTPATTVGILRHCL